jgi:hypothetical protein
MGIGVFVGVGSAWVIVGERVTVVTAIRVLLGEGEVEGTVTVDKDVAVRVLQPTEIATSHPKQTSQKKEGVELVLMRSTSGVISIVLTSIFCERPI